MNSPEINQFKEECLQDFKQHCLLQTQHLRKRCEDYFPKNHLFSLEAIKNCQPEKIYIIQAFAGRLLQFSADTLYYLPPEFEDFKNMVKLLNYIIQCDNITICKQLAKRYAHEFVMIKNKNEESILEKIEKIKQSSMYPEIEKGINSAVYEFLFNIYKE